jgi:glycerophosphoryl diester phosphodiesterase
VRIIKEAGMEEQCVLISLNYALINYTETAYPDMKTGYLTFLSFGNTAALNCDYLGLEEESATGSAIRAIHEQGKKVLVWTPNEPSSQKHFLLSKADGIITDHVSQAFGLISQLEKRTDFEKIVDGIFN